jgi:hypothetical protein
LKEPEICRYGKAAKQAPAAVEATAGVELEDFTVSGFCLGPGGRKDGIVIDAWGLVDKGLRVPVPLFIVPPALNCCCLLLY